MIRGARVFFTSFFLLLFVDVSFANDKKSEGDDKLSFLDSYFFSLSKKQENSFDAASAIYVLSSEDIRRSGATSIPEALRMVPGLQVARIDGNKWAISARGFNRQYSNKLLIMIDGRTVYNSVFSGALWDDFDHVMDDIEKIEVIRGPGGSIWGANAVNGIINIITKNAAETQGTYISQTFGNNDRSITEVRHGNRFGDNNFRIYAKRADRGGFDRLNSDVRNDDAMLQDRVGFRYDKNSDKYGKISLHGDFYDQESQQYFANLVTPEPSDKNGRGGNIVANWNKTLSRKSSVLLQSYYNYVQADMNVLKVDEETFDLDFQHYYDFSSENQLIWGLAYRNTWDALDFGTANGIGAFSNTTYVPISYSPHKRNIETYSAFLQEKIGLIPHELYLTIGSKFEHNDLTGFEFQPNARLAYYPTRNQTIWTSVSRAIRTPTRGEDNITAKQATQLGNLTILQGNNTYRSESVISYEIGYRVKPISDISIDLATFYNDYGSLRTIESPTSLGTPIARNNGAGYTYGFELATKWQVSNDLRLEFSYDFLKENLDLVNGSTELTTLLNPDKLTNAEQQSPQNQFRLRALYNISTNIEFDNSLYYIDSLPLSGTSSTHPAGVGSYVRWDTRLGYLIGKHLDLSFGVQNITDDKHQEFGPGLFGNRTEVPRTYYVKAVLQF